MLITAQDRVLEAFSALEHNAHFKEILLWIEDSKDSTLDQMIDERIDSELHRKQGAACDLLEIITVAAQARAILQR